MPFLLASYAVVLGVLALYRIWLGRRHDELEARLRAAPKAPRPAALRG